MTTPERANREGDTQPLPTPSSHPVAHDLVKDDLDLRLQLGIRRYGQPLQPFNGRDAIRDAYEEALDLAVYLRCALYESTLTDTTPALRFGQAVDHIGRLWVAPVEDGAALITAERRRQIDVEGWTPQHDDQHSPEELSFAAICYVVEASRPGHRPEAWPWEPAWWKPSPDPIRNLVKAGALLAAEIDRRLRAGSTPVPADVESEAGNGGQGSDDCDDQREFHVIPPKGEGHAECEPLSDRPTSNIGMQTPPSGGAS